MRLRRPCAQGVWRVRCGEGAERAERAERAGVREGQSSPFRSLDDGDRQCWLEQLPRLAFDGVRQC